MSSQKVHWDKEIAVEKIGGKPYRMYVYRPRRIEDLLTFATRWGGRPYIVQGETTLTFRDLLDAVAAKADRLAAIDIVPGARVLLHGWNGPEWVVNFWACLQIGAVPVLGNAWWSDGDVAYAMESLSPVLALADTHGATKLPAAARLGPWEIGAGPDETRNAGEKRPTSPDENDPASIIFTSGTEGRAKAVVLSHRSLIATQQMLLHVTRRLPYRPDETYGEVSLHTGPLFHIGGIGALIRGVLLGNTIVFPRGRFDPGEAIDLIERYQISRWNAVPTMATRLLDHPDIRRRDMSSLRTMTLGGAPLHGELLARIRTVLPGLHARVATGYGLSENAGQATAASGADTAETPGSSGRPLPLVEVKIAERPSLPDGEVLVRSPTQMLGYAGGEESPIDDDGWLHTGDLGHIDERGHLWITGREKDIIIRGGENIAPAAVERALLEVSGIVEAAVVGIPHPDLGEEVGAFVVVSGDHTQADLEEGLRSSLASYAMPSRWWVRKHQLPVNQTGKVDKPALLAQAKADA